MTKRARIALWLCLIAAFALGTVIVARRIAQNEATVIAEPRP